MSFLDPQVAKAALQAALQALNGACGTYKILLLAPDQVMLQKDSLREPIPDDALLFGYVDFKDQFTPNHLLSKPEDLAAMARSICEIATARPAWVEKGYA